MRGPRRQRRAAADALELGVGVAIAGAVDVNRLPAGAAAFAAQFTITGSTLTLQNLPAVLAAAGTAAVVPYIDTTRVAAGELHAGSVRVPDDHENVSMELSRRQALEDHELMHTIQSARLGPLMLVAFPLWALELAADLTAAGGPEFASYVPGELRLGRLRVEGSGFEDGTDIQMAQSRKSVTVELGAVEEDGRFRFTDKSYRTLSVSGMRDGPVQVRRALGGTGTDVLEWITNIGQLLTIGGLLNVVSVAGWGGVAALITRSSQACKAAVEDGPPAGAGPVTATSNPRSNIGPSRRRQICVRSGERHWLCRLVCRDRSRSARRCLPAATVEVSVLAGGAVRHGQMLPPASPTRTARHGSRSLHSAARRRSSTSDASGSAMPPAARTHAGRPWTAWWSGRARHQETGGISGSWADREEDPTGWSTSGC